MAFEAFLPTTGYTSIGYTSFPTGGATFGLTISANTTLASPPLSGTATTVAYLLSGTMFPSAANSTLTAASDRIFLRLGSNIGNQDVYGFLTNVTYTSATSTFSTSIDFNDLNFTSTLIGVSGNSTSCVVLTAGSIVTNLDNPFYSASPYTSVVGGLSTVNLGFKTVCNHARLWNLNG